MASKSRFVGTERMTAVGLPTVTGNVLITRSTSATPPCWTSNIDVVRTISIGGNRLWTRRPIRFATPRPVAQTISVRTRGRLRYRS